MEEWEALTLSLFGMFQGQRGHLITFSKLSGEEQQMNRQWRNICGHIPPFPIAGQARHSRAVGPRF